MRTHSASAVCWSGCGCVEPPSLRGRPRGLASRRSPVKRSIFAVQIIDPDPFDSCVLNNPLVYTDPSGYSFWTKVRQPLAAVAVMVATYGTGSHLAAASYEATAIATDAAVTSGAVTAEAGSVAMAAASTTAGNITAAFTIAGGFAGGGISGGNIESAVLGAIQATASMGIGDATYHGSAPPSAALYAKNVLAHAALGCGMSVGAGGSCKSGGLAGAFSAAAGPVISGLTEGNFAAGLAGRMAAGCVGSYIGKGSCEAGAVSGAFDYLFNHCGHGGCDFGDKLKAMGEGMFSVVTGTGNAFRFIGRGTGLMGEEERLRFNQEGEAADSFARKLRDDPEFRKLVSASVTTEAQKFLHDNQDGWMKWFVTGRAVTGIFTGFGPAAFIGDFTRAVENGHGMVEALFPGGVAGQPEKKR